MGHQVSSDASIGVLDPCGSRQMAMQACPLDSLLAGIKIRNAETEPLEGHRLSGGSCIEEYLNSQDSSQLHNKVLIHGYIRLIFYGILIALALFVIGTYIFFFTSYQEFLGLRPTISVTTIEQGVISG